MDGPDHDGPPAFTERFVALGRVAWAAVGIALAVVAVALVVQRISLVVVSFLVALFPAALLGPAADVLKRRGVPGAVAALAVLAGFFGIVALIVRLLTPRVSVELPELLDAASEGVGSIERWLSDSPLPVEVGQVEDSVRAALEDLAAGDVLQQGLGAALLVVDVATGALLALVVVFFVLKDGRRLWHGALDLLPPGPRRLVDHAGSRVWWTLGAYIRGQLLVALFDAVFIGLGLWILDVPLVLPLAVLVFFGGLFPIVGAFVSGLAAVLVALASDGFTTALLVLGVVVVVQQVEGNLLEPLILSRVISLHPLVVILSITAGAVWLGILGAFLAVPVVASTARVVDLVRGRTPDAGPGADGQAVART
ncbi:MAG TPA: AI-2E family transporter [Mycobacteriales bacterium]|nr:AI-2E family transporter [Mycobacteriales bacterium]